MTQRLWVSWWSGNYRDEGATEPPFQVWQSGSRARPKDAQRDDLSLCAVLDVPDTLNSADVFSELKRFYPDAEMRFSEKHEPDWTPGERFPDFEGRTMLALEDGSSPAPPHAEPA